MLGAYSGMEQCPPDAAWPEPAASSGGSWVVSTGGELAQSARGDRETHARPGCRCLGHYRAVKRLRFFVATEQVEDLTLAAQRVGRRG